MIGQHLHWQRHLGTITLLLCVIILFQCSNAVDELDLPKTVDFNYHIRPILSQNCYTCHGPDPSSREADLRLDTEEGATGVLKHGRAAVVPGDIAKSLLIERITSPHANSIMPPPESKKALSNREIELLKRWVKQGAKWKPHWAFIPPENPKLSSKQKPTSPSAIIDYLIGVKQKEKGLEISAKAPKAALIRRISYLLTGLPPTSNDLDNFISDSTPSAYEKMVQQYLDSPQFGERWARHWMDLVRYAEYMGHEFDFPIDGAWHYRDYLIRAFNDDVPYDQLVKEHLAGDLLEYPRYNKEKGFNESILGTGFLYLGEGKHSPVSIKQEEADRIDNMIDVTSKTFQALTVACAKCHDHKFDPILAKDYYAMYGMLESTRIGPLAARSGIKHQDIIQQLSQIKAEIRSEIVSQQSRHQKTATPVLIKHQKSFIQNLPNIDTAFQILGDFSANSWGEWQTNGLAFGSNPLHGEPRIDSKTKQIDIINGAASSRAWSSGVMGTLQSPNFTVEDDYILVKARGINGNIRLIADNFQLIQFPLYGHFEKAINNEKWDTYIMDVSMAKGNKAYLQFMAGKYERHDFQIDSNDYIEIQYAVSFNNDSLSEQIVAQIERLKEVDASLNVDAWVEQNGDFKNGQAIQKWLKNNPIKANPALAKLFGQYNSLGKQLYDSTHFIGIQDGQAVYSPVFLRGSINQLSEQKVPHQFLSTIRSNSKEFPQNGSGRLAWAEAVVNPENPLTARVMVNRIWHHLFGTGLVETVDNFGLQGKMPSHPELLDYLAIQFIEEDWSIKTMIKHIVLSETFQRSTQSLENNTLIDPDNRLLHHFPVRRLEAEAIRDGILAISGRLDLTMYGASVPIHITEFMTGRGKPSSSGSLDGEGRRSIYIAVRRNFLSPMMLTFDMPIPFSTFGRRNVTNVPAQSLALMNDPFVHEQAKNWAEGLLSLKHSDIEERVQFIYKQAFSRSPSKEELNEARTFIEEIGKNYGLDTDSINSNLQVWTDYCHSIFNIKEFIHLL